MKHRRQEDAFSAFFAVEADRIQRFAIFNCGDADLAADLAQEALARTYCVWSRVENDEPGAYARRIVVNMLRDRHRRERVRRLKPLGALPSSTPSKEGASLDRLSMTELLKTLPPVQRAVVVLRFYEDMAEKQIADLLDRPLGTVKSDLHRALKALRPLIAAERQDTGGTRGN